MSIKEKQTQIMSKEEWGVQAALGTICTEEYLKYVWKEHIKIYKKEVSRIHDEYKHKSDNKFNKWRFERALHNFVKKWKINFETICKKLYDNITVRWTIIVPLTHCCTLSNGMMFQLYLIELWYGHNYE